MQDVQGRQPTSTADNTAEKQPGGAELVRRDASTGVRPALLPETGWFLPAPGLRQRTARRSWRKRP